jgi:antitoxin component HigA of HigAB toxin-antitoxin module
VQSKGHRRQSYQSDAFGRSFTDRTLDSVRSDRIRPIGELLGNRSLGSKVLREERQMSKEHIRKLSGRFSVSSDLFL